MTKRYGGLAAVDEVTLEFPPRGISCLIGPNGAGKSTLLDLLSGRQRPTAGTVALDDQDLTRRQPFRSEPAAVWPSSCRSRRSTPELSTRENLWLACYSMPRDIEEADRRVGGLLEWLELGDERKPSRGTLVARPETVA